MLRKRKKNGQGLKYLIQIRRNSENPGSRPMQFLISKLVFRVSRGPQ